MDGDQASSVDREAIIEAIKSKPILYDSDYPTGTSNKSFHKNKAYSEAAADLGMSIEDLKKRWKNIKDAYMKYLKTSTSDNPYVKKPYGSWRWASRMSYFKPYFSKNCSGPEARPETSTDTKMALLKDSSEDGKPWPQKRKKYVAEVPEEEVVEEEIPPVEPESPPTFLDEEISNDRFDQQPAPLYSLMDMDATEMMFLAYAKTVKTFSPKRQVMVKMKIAQIIMEQEVKQIEEREKRK